MSNQGSTSAHRHLPPILGCSRRTAPSKLRPRRNCTNTQDRVARSPLRSVFQTAKHKRSDSPRPACGERKKTHLFVPAAHSARVVREPRPPENRGRRESRARDAPAASRAKIKSTRVSHHRFAGRARPSLRNGFNGFLRALPGDRALLPPSLSRIASLRT